MIISHKHRFIFFAIPRTATHALRFALREQLAGTDYWEQVLLHHQSKLPVPELSLLPDGHITVQEAKTYLDQEIWKSYYKFTIARNPFDRFISSVFFKKRRYIEQFNPRAYMHLLLQEPGLEKDVLFRPQTDFMLDKNGQSAMDYVGSFENLQGAFDEICRMTGLKPMLLEHRNSSEHLPYQEYYDEKLYENVKEFYKKDFQILGYPSTLRADR